MTESDSQPVYCQSINRVLSGLNSDSERGLTSETARERLKSVGPNRLAKAAPDPWWKKLLVQFNQLVVWILIAAAVISGILGDWTDTVAIAAIVILNGLLGYLQEARAEKALEALQEMSSPMAKVRRDGALRSIPASELVPGDILEIDAGDHISADARLMTSFSLSVQEAALTGVTLPPT